MTAMIRLVIATQHEENYGAHDWDGEGSCPQYWKSKGGNTYVIDCDYANVETYRDEITALIEASDEYSKEYVIDSSIVDTDQTPWEEWSPPYFITRNFYGNYVAQRESYAGTLSFVMMPSGDRSEYHLSRKEAA